MRWFLVVLTIFAFGVYATITIIGAAMDNAPKPPRVPDETPPTIALNGGENVTVRVNSSYEDAGVEAYDDRSEVKIEVNGEVNTAIEGEYTITYVATDEDGNIAEVTRTVKVIQPTGVIYLTFDDGPGPYTAQLLDVLKKYNVKATFFVTGSGDDAMIKREYDEGHTVGLHTFSHNYGYIYQNMSNYFADLYAVQERVKNITGQTSMLMRFPGGSSNLVSAYYDGGTRIMSTLVNEVARRGFTYFDWNISSGDADGVATTDEVFARVIANLKPGGSSVVLQHDIKDFSVAAVERIIAQCLASGYVFEKLDANSFTAHHGVNN